ncbi:hypothetical protein HanPI659440_Chr01g0022441 [Helianthus annuus]|nr:hypothetical protein HanPI659440_Chr01g0022441 [Helianthus annuus]
MTHGLRMCLEKVNHQIRLLQGDVRRTSLERSDNESTSFQLVHERQIVDHSECDFDSDHDCYYYAHGDCSWNKNLKSSTPSSLETRHWKDV